MSCDSSIGRAMIDNPKKVFENPKKDQQSHKEDLLRPKKNPDISQHDSSSMATLSLRNPHLTPLKSDELLHLALSSSKHNLAAMFGDVQFVCMGGSQRRMEQFARHIQNEIGHLLPPDAGPSDTPQLSDRYSMYKIGPVLAVSHGIGMPSISVLLHELIKLMHHAKVKSPTFLRLGTCGGVGVPGGQLVITESVVDGLLRPYLEQVVLGTLQRRPAVLDRQLVTELKSLSTPEDPWNTYIGRTMCTTGFYECQGRLDGAFCEFSEDEKMAYLREIHAQGVINIEMESLTFAALCHHAGIRAAVVCVSYLDRLQGDQADMSDVRSNNWELYPQRLVSRYIRLQLERQQQQQRQQLDWQQ